MYTCIVAHGIPATTMQIYVKIMNQYQNTFLIIVVQAYNKSGLKAS